MIDASDYFSVFFLDFHPSSGLFGTVLSSTPEGPPVNPDVVKVLIVEGNEGDVARVRHLLGERPSFATTPDHAATFRDGLTRISCGHYDVCLISAELGPDDGIALIRTAHQLGCSATMILIVNQDGADIGTLALEAGAADYLVKNQFDAETLQRVIRHALHRGHLETELRSVRDSLEKRVEGRTAELCDAVAALQQEIDRRESVEQQFREAEERYRIIFEEAMNPIILMDAVSGTFVQFNNQACRQLGYDKETFAKMALPDIEARESPSQCLRHLQQIVSKGGDVYETTHRTSTGETRDILVSARPILLSGTKFLLAIFHDFTERKQMEDELRSAVIRLEQHDKAKSEFVANVSHELKTPLTSMQYGVRNLLKGIAGPLPDHAMRYLKLFDAECRRLVATIDDILDLGKIDNRALTLSPVTTPLGHLLRRCIETLRPQADAAGVTLVLAPNPAFPFIRCDPNMIQRVLQNLLGNAVKFTPSGGSVNLHVGIDPEQRDMARLTVTDTGIGIPAEALPHIAKRYFRAGRHASGSGLGLAISKDIVLLHGGTFTVDSPPPGQAQGTLITLTLPLAPPPTVLVADDDPSVQTLLTRHLTAQGYRVIAAVSGQDAILSAEANRPDLILLDLIMEDIHGTTVILTLKGSPHIRYIPIIAITGAALDEATTDILTRFSIPTLPKPWNLGELLDTIETALIGMTAFQVPAPEKETVS